MKREKKKRSPNRSFKSGEAAELPLEVIILDEVKEVQMLFVLTNRSIKMLKSGLVQEKLFLKDGRQHKLAIMHREIYDEKYKPIIEIKKLHIKEKHRQECEAKEAQALTPPPVVGGETEQSE